MFSILLFSALVAPPDQDELPSARPAGQLELVATFEGPMPTGVSVSRTGRIFVSFPRWGDDVSYGVAEIKAGRALAYPDAASSVFDESNAEGTLVSVQSVVVDSADRLWILDTGSIEFAPPLRPKLVGVDLATDTVFKVILFPADVALTTTYLNDVRFDLRKGSAGVAYITDSAENGMNGIIVVDLDSGKSWRRLHDHPTTKADKHFRPIIEGRPFFERKPGQHAKTIAMGADGIAISNDGQYLYYCPLASRHFYRVPTSALLDTRTSDDDLGNLVEDLGDRGFASDGLETDDQGRLYFTNFEHNAIFRYTTDGKFETLVYDPRVLWPDTLSVAADGYLYFIVNQLHRQKQFHNGRDLREKPYSLFRIKIDAGPVNLGNRN